MISPQGSRWYEPVDAALLRAATTSSDLDLPRQWPSLDNEIELERWCRWLVEVWAHDHVARAVAIASPTLAARISEACEGQRPRASQVKGMVVSLARYLLRMRGRATPFGLFAGVAPLRFGEELAAVWEPGSQWIRTRADAVWLARVIAELEANHDLRRRLPVVLNDQVVVRGDRLVVTWQPHANDPTRGASAEVSMRLTPEVQIVCEQARSPIAVADLIDKIAAESTTAPIDAIDALLAQLIVGGVLITTLRPPSTCTDGLAHLLARLGDVDAGSVANLSPLLLDLWDVHARLSAGDVGTSARMLDLADAEYPVMVDLRVGCGMVLPAEVAVEAAAAVGALVRLTPHPDGNAGWRTYHWAFLSRYGANGLVPVSMLIDPVCGLGFPDHYANPGADLPAVLSRRETLLLAVAQQAALDGVRQVVLDDAFIDSLHPDRTDELRPPPHLELCAEVWASSMTALAGGDFRLAVSGLSRTGTALAGRFVDLLPEHDQQRRRGEYVGLPVGVDGALTAQLSFPPCHPHLENVARAPRLLPDLITVGEHRTGEDGCLPLEDLAVTADNNGMYVVSLSRRRVVEPMLANAAARRTMPPIVRLLFEIPRARIAAASPFAWGVARCLPFLPRVVYGRTVLAPARWSIQATDLPAPGTSDEQWHEAFGALRERLGLPGAVSVGESDLRLRLDLDKPMDLAVLRDYLDKARIAGEAVLVSETSTAADHGWFGGRAHEIIVPLASALSAAPAPAVLARPGMLTTVRRDHGVLPGGRILFAKLYGDPQAFDAILIAHLPRLLFAWPEPLRWWFIRYRDTDPHLRLRLHLDGLDYGQAVTQVARWADDLRQRGLIRDLIFDTYYPETVRYGAGDAQAAVEALFAADSAAVLAQLRVLAAGRSLPPRALIAASMVDLVVSLTGGVPAGMRWLIDHGDIGAAAPAPRDVVRHAVQFACDSEAMTALPGGLQITEAWRARRQAADTYRHHLDAGPLETLPVVRSLLHMNHIRSHGIDLDSERACHRLARAVALAWTSRQPSSGEGDR